VQEHKRVSPASRSSFDYFGGSLSVDGDRFVVGEGPSGGETAAAYVYRFDGVDWNGETTLNASDAAGEDSISPVALSGDFVAGGAWQDDANGVNSGAAYLFRLSGQ
jgi:hypothetical protein